MTSEAAWAIISILSGIVTVLVGSILYLYNEISRRNEAKWQRAIDLSKIAADQEENLLTRQIAMMALEASKIDFSRRAEQLDRHPLLRFDVVADVVDPLPPKRVYEAISDATASFDGSERAGGSVDEDIEIAGRFYRRVIEAVWHLEHAFERAHAEGRPENDRRIRIFVVIVVIAMSFFVMAASNIFQALFNLRILDPPLL
ncbi:MAG: hypothetical protein K9G59_01925 [Caulobacter sp.]|nr:hypothetical protein [Caulobacter sp.]